MYDPHSPITLNQYATGEIILTLDWCSGFPVGKHHGGNHNYTLSHCNSILPLLVHGYEEGEEGADSTPNPKEEGNNLLGGEGVRVVSF